MIVTEEDALYLLLPFDYDLLRACLERVFILGFLGLSLEHFSAEVNILLGRRLGWRYLGLLCRFNVFH